jgi:hypothetical protein
MHRLSLGEERDRLPTLLGAYSTPPQYDDTHYGQQCADNYGHDGTRVRAILLRNASRDRRFAGGTPNRSGRLKSLVAHRLACRLRLELLRPPHRGVWIWAYRSVTKIRYLLLVSKAPSVSI